MRPSVRLIGKEDAHLVRETPVGGPGLLHRHVRGHGHIGLDLILGLVDPVEAWVWLSLAADTGEGDAAAARDQVAKGLTAAEKEDARNRLEALRKDAGAKEG